MKVISYPDLNVCRGEFNIKRWTNCTGFLNFKNNHTYQGPFLNGKKHGRGVYTWPNGDTFVGEFDNGIYTQGIYKWNNGNKYMGSLNPSSKIQEKYNKHGLGISKNNNEIYIGDFSQNNYHGVGIKKQNYGKNKIREGEFKRGSFIKKRNADFKIRQIKNHLRYYINRDEDIRKFVDHEISVKNKIRNS